METYAQCDDFHAEGGWEFWISEIICSSSLLSREKSILLLFSLVILFYLTYRYYAQDFAPSFSIAGAQS